MVNKALRILLWMYGIYIALCLLVVMPAANLLAPQLVADALNRELRFEAIVINPFTLAVIVHDARLADSDGSDFVALERAEVNLSTTSLWQPGVVLDVAAVDSLFVHVKKRASGEFNIDDLLASDDTTSESQGELPAITIGDLNLHARRIQVSAHDRATPYTTHWDNLKLHVDDLTTVSTEGRPYELRLAGQHGGTLHWQGELSIPGAFSRGHIALHNISLRPMGRFAAPWVNFDVADGRLDVATDYDVSWDSAVSYQLDNGSAALRQLSLQPKAGQELADTGVALKALRISDIAVDGDRQQVVAEQLSVEALDLATVLLAENITLAQLLTPAVADDPAPTPQDEPETSAGTTPWQVSLNRFSVADSRLDWRSSFTNPQHLAIAPISAQVSNLHWPTGGSSPLQGQLRINDHAQLDINGEIDIASGNGEIDLALNALPVYWFGPNLEKNLNTTLDTGEIDTTTHITLADFAPLRVTSDGAISDFSVTVAEAENAITRWKSVAWQGLAVAVPEQEIALQRLVLDQFSGRLHIHKDGTINTQRAIAERLEERAQEAGEESTPAEPSAPWAFALQEIHIVDSQLDFMDESLPLPFRTIIGGLNGGITALDSQATEPAQVDIKGSVDGYAPVLLSGSAAPFGELPALDLALSLQGVDLTALTPYSGTYAGHAIERGLINLDLQYALADNRLKGDNRVVVDQLKLGERVDSDKAVDLPLGLAIALLTDANGVIDLAVPVKGDVDDPEFSLGSVIFGAFVNLITKAVTAPFNLLASLVSSEENLQRVNFAAGSSELDAAATQRLDLLAEALNKRPGLTLVARGSTHPQHDREQLQKAALDQQLLSAGLSAGDISEHTPAWEEAVRKRYQAQGEVEADLPIALQYQHLWQNLAVADETLSALAQERATSAKRYLVNTAGLGSDRAVIEWDKPGDDAAAGFSGVEMALD